MRRLTGRLLGFRLNGARLCRLARWTGLTDALRLRLRLDLGPLGRRALLALRVGSLSLFDCGLGLSLLSMGLLGVRLHWRGSVVLLLSMLLRMLLLVVRMLWLRCLRWLCGVGSIIHRLVAPSHVRLLWLLLW